MLKKLFKRKPAENFKIPEPRYYGNTVELKKLLEQRAVRYLVEELGFDPDEGFNPDGVSEEDQK